ncbi:MAG: TonB-dependent receptor [Ferruginibacter sp.]
MKKKWHKVLLFAPCILVMAILQLLPGQLMAQSNKISGTVTGTNNEPLVGATVTVKQSKKVSVTDIAGKFSIEANPGQTLVITTVGFEARELAVGNQNNISISLNQVASTLNDLVVVAYGTQKKKDITGAVAIVNVAETKKYSTSDVAQLLQGRASGVQVNSDGQPGAVPSVRIRGFATFGNAQPLYVIDGVQVGTVVRDFSPNDIESIQVLKDASAAALYGSAAANGVIIVTTKQGRKNTALKVEYNGYYGVDNVWQIMPVLDRANYQLLNNEARKNAARPLAPGNDPASPKYITNINTDWQKEGLKQGNRQNHNVAFSGGGVGSSYLVSLDYFKNNGTYVGNGPDYTRYTARVNSSAEKGIFKIGENMFYAHSHSNNLNPTTGNDLAGALPPLINTLVFAIPTMGIYDPNRDGGFAGTLSTVEDVISMNGIGLNSILKNTTDVDRTFANVYGEVQLLKNNGHNLKYKINLSYDKTQVRDYAFKPSFDLGYFFQSPIAKLNDNSSVFTTGIVENTLNYQKNFDKHAVEILAGQTYQKTTSLFRNGYAEGFTKPYYPVLGGGGAPVTASSGSLIEYAKASYLARVNYNYDDRYLVTASGRRDASSRFSPAARVGYFPSIAVGWRLTNEKFIKLPRNIVSDIKLRGSYGKLGNDNIGDYVYQPTINPGVVYTFNGIRYVGAISTNIVDENIKWEDRTSSNIGLDALLLNGKLDFSAEYYNNKTIDVLVGVPIPQLFGSINDRPTVNAATVKNSGLEFSATWHKNRGAFTYDISANLSTVKNKVTSLGANKEPIYGAGSITRVGTEIGQHFGFVYEGIFQTPAEVTAHAFQNIKTAPGDIKFKDISGPAGKPDNVIDDYDRQVLGSGIPKYHYGMNFSAGYKGFDFSLFAAGSAKFLINERLYRDLMHTGGSTNYHEDMLRRWTPTNTNTEIPRVEELDPNNNGRNSNRPGWLQSGTFLRINTLSVGYNFTNGLIKGVSKLRVYVTAQNLYSFQKYKGYNPDFTSGVFNPGFDGGSYPKPRTIMGGVQVSF